MVVGGVTSTVFECTYESCEETVSRACGGLPRREGKGKESHQQKRVRPDPTLFLPPPLSPPPISPPCLALYADMQAEARAPHRPPSFPPPSP
jgi:hypothetical protein